MPSHSTRVKIESEKIALSWGHLFSCSQGLTTNPENPSDWIWWAKIDSKISILNHSVSSIQTQDITAKHFFSPRRHGQYVLMAPLKLIDYCRPFFLYFNPYEAAKRSLYALTVGNPGDSRVKDTTKLKMEWSEMKGSGWSEGRKTRRKSLSDTRSAH